MRSCQLRQISICQFSSRSWTFEEDLARYQILGFDSIGVWRKKINDCGSQQAIDRLYESKLSVSSLHHAGGFTGDGSTIKESIADTFDAIRLAAKINAGVLLIHPGSINNHLVRHASNIYQSALDQIIPFAESLDVQLAIEPILDQPNSQFTFHKKIQDTIELLAANPSLGVSLDLYHTGMDFHAFDRLHEFADRIKLVQLADRTTASWAKQRLANNRRQSFRLPLGEGAIDIQAWLRRLAELGYAGPFELEVYGTQTQHRCPFNLLDQTKTYISDSMRSKVASNKAANATATTQKLPASNPTSR